MREEIIYLHINYNTHLFVAAHTLICYKLSCNSYLLRHLFYFLAWSVAQNNDGKLFEFIISEYSNLNEYNVKFKHASRQASQYYMD